MIKKPQSTNTLPHCSTCLLEDDSCCPCVLPVMLGVNAYSNLPGSRNGKCSVWIGARFTVDDDSCSNIHFKLRLKRDSNSTTIWPLPSRFTGRSGTDGSGYRWPASHLKVYIFKTCCMISSHQDCAVGNVWYELNFNWPFFDITIIVRARIVNQQELFRLVWRVDLIYDLCLVCRLMV